MRIQKSHLHDTVSQKYKHPQRTSWIHRKDRRNVHYETDLENTKEPYNTRPTTQYHSLLSRKDIGPTPTTDIGQRSAMMMMMAASFADPRPSDLAAFFGLFFAFLKGHG